MATFFGCSSVISSVVPWFLLFRPSTVYSAAEGKKETKLVGGTFRLYWNGDPPPLKAGPGKESDFGLKEKGLFYGRETV